MYQAGGSTWRRVELVHRSSASTGVVLGGGPRTGSTGRLDRVLRQTVDLFQRRRSRSDAWTIHGQLDVVATAEHAALNTVDARQQHCPYIQSSRRPTRQTFLSIG